MFPNSASFWEEIGGDLSFLQLVEHPRVEARGPKDENAIFQFCGCGSSLKSKPNSAGHPIELTGRANNAFRSKAFCQVFQQTIAIAEGVHVTELRNQKAFVVSHVRVTAGKAVR